MQGRDGIGEVVRALAHEGPVDQVGVHDAPQHRGEEERVGARARPQMQVRLRGEFGAARVHHDERRAAARRLDDARADHRMRCRGVGAGDEDHVGMSEIGERARGRGEAELRAHRLHRRRVAEPCTVIHVARAERAAEHTSAPSCTCSSSGHPVPQ